MDKKINSETNDYKAVVHSLEEMNGSMLSGKLILFLILVTLIGVGSGYFLVSNGMKVGPVDMGKIKDSSSISKGTVVGSGDTKTFKDTAEGVLEKGGVEGEGEYHLVRPGGDSQNVYLTSSIIDLSKFIGKKIKIWGETHSSQRAGWLMDVGRVEVLE